MTRQQKRYRSTSASTGSSSLLETLQHRKPVVPEVAAPSAPSFIFTAGDDVTDEEMFLAAQKWTGAQSNPASFVTVNVRVGRNLGSSAANFSLASVADTQAFIVALYEASRRAST